MGVRLWGEPLGRILRVGGICGIYSLSVVTMVALAWRGRAFEVGYLYVALTPPSKAWRAAAVSRILREFQSSCMIFIFTVQI